MPVLFGDELTDRVFGVVSNGRNEYKLGWQSDSIDPVVMWINTMVCSIGIDLIFIVFEFNTGKILQKLSFNYFFYDTKIFNGFLYVITELEIIKMDVVDMRIIEEYALPDYFKSIDFNDQSIKVQCLDGNVVNI